MVAASMARNHRQFSDTEGRMTARPGITIITTVAILAAAGCRPAIRNGDGPAGGPVSGNAEARQPTTVLLPTRVFIVAGQSNAVGYNAVGEISRDNPIDRRRR